MPYITCKDGKTYSRYDNSKYVKDCICNEKKEQNRKFNKCMQDPSCKKEYEERQEFGNNLVFYGGITLALLFIFAIYIIVSPVRKP